MQHAIPVQEPQAWEFDLLNRIYALAHTMGLSGQSLPRFVVVTMSDNEVKRYPITGMSVEACAFRMGYRDGKSNNQRSA